jgi:hypothetical protein
MWFAPLLLVAMILGTTPASAQAELHEEFAADQLDLTSWCACQINLDKAPIQFTKNPDDIGDGIVTITADVNSLGGNKCRKDANECGRPASQPDLAEPLGPSLIERALPAAPQAVMSAVNYCTEEIEALAEAAGEEGDCIQRQELRLQKRYQHPANQPHVYTLRFRMPAVIEDRVSSTRWITAQWKHEPISDAYDALGEDWGPSPFLAQRFDDGVLHVTVQDEHCRCKIASAPLPDGKVEEWRDGTPTYCLWTGPGEERACTPSLVAEYGPDPVLDSPIGSWVEMKYRVQAGRSPPATIEVWQGDRFIVRITGKIGYEPGPGETSRTKFKAGHYRDYMPFVHTMEIDRVSVKPAGP